MSRSPLSRVVVVLLVVLLSLTVLVVTWPSARAATWTQDTDTDFNAGNLNGVEVVGTGAPAVIQILKDATDWSNQNPSTHPGAREGPAMAYDSTNGVVVMFGGYSGGYLGDTWEYTPGTNTWLQTSSTGPSARELSGLAFDSANGLIVLFGGVSNSGFENDTWEYNAATDGWTQRNPSPAPPLLVDDHLAYDSAASVQRSILVGMNVVNNQMVTWAYNAGSHTWSNRAPSPNLPQRTSFAMGYHVALDRVVMFGGTLPFPPPGSLEGTTYEYNWALNSWTQTSSSGPSARNSAGVSYRPELSSLVLFGGNSGSALSDTWRYFDNAGTRQWVPMLAQHTPPARDTFGMADEASNGMSVIFGGILNGGSDAQDTWAFGAAYRSQGMWKSQVFDSTGANAVWNAISWSMASMPAGTTIRFQLAVSNAPAGPFNNYIGPDCTFSTYYTTSGTSICASQSNNRYLRIFAQLITGDDAVTPAMDSVTIDYTVAASSPYIVTTSPANADFNVPQTTPIFVRFSERMDTTSLIYTVSPSTSTSTAWSENDSAVTINHAAPLLECKAYTVTITQAKDLAGTDLISNPVDPSIANPFSFVTECINPWIRSESPSQGTTDNPLNANIVVDFSENMNATSVSWTITPTLAGVSGTWSNGTQQLTLTHTTIFEQCEYYQVNVTGKDLAGLSLVPGPVPNPWNFQVHCTVPYILSTSPSHLQAGVALTTDIVVTFSEPMVPSTVTWTLVPAAGTLSASWSGGNAILILSHATPFVGCTPYTANITGGKDADEGLDLFPGRHQAHAPHPWKFMTVCPNPFLVVTIPEDGNNSVNANSDIILQFSEAMNTVSVTYSISPTILFQPTWNPQSQILTLAHAQPFSCGQNTFTVNSGTDADESLPLVPGPAPNPFRFTPTCPGPIIQFTDPADGATNVPLNAVVTVTFSVTMNETSVTWTSLPPLNFTSSWSPDSTVLTLTHAVSFAQRTNYTMAILSGTDLAGNNLLAGPTPNPWRFQTVGVNPQILTTDPAGGATNVGASDNVVVTFSQAMDTTTVVATPSPVIVFNYAWTNNNTVLTLSHIQAFNECAQYTIQVTGNNPAGDLLIAGPVPNPWSFTTACFSPFIVDTNPASGATNVPATAPIWVNFSKAMDKTTVLAVAAPPVAFTYTWSNGDKTLELTHATPFQDCTGYTITVSGKDTSANNLVAGPVPNPWTFTVACPAPFIVSTNPANGATNVVTTFTVTVTFSQAMNPATVVWTFTPPTTGTITSNWIAGNTILTLSFSQPQAECTTYQVLIQGDGANGQPLVAGPVANPWQFSTVCTVGTPGGLTVTRLAPTTVHLAWNAVVPADSYNVYSATSRFAAWPWTLLGNVATTAFDATGHLTDGNSHYYIVRALRGATLGLNSTMGVKIQLNVAFNPAATNVWWFSLPYRSEYTKASDIANELGSTRIDVVAKWNPATQGSITYVFFRGAWRGTDFPIGPGDGLWISVRTTFAWNIVGTDRAQTLAFTLNAPPLGNVNWRGIPYTGTYTRASDLVRDIEGGIGPGANTKIVEVVKWNAATQTVLRYFWTTAGWTGSDFTVNPGDGIYFRIVSSFTWQPRLVTPEVP